MDIKYDIFLEGSTIDLCIPTEEIAYESDWYSWFNQKKINKFLVQGTFPNTREQQKRFFQEESASGKRLILLIVTKGGVLKGVISLSKIDFRSSTAELALVIDDKIERKTSRLASLEAVALITEHGFEVMHLDRISAGQSRLLEGWQRRMELLGYRVEGVHKNTFYESREKKGNTVTIACNYEDYKKVIGARGKLFDNEGPMLKRIKEMTGISVASRLETFLYDIENEYYHDLWK
ncbi:GNAT family N-acetyltransferase [Kiloniella sp.]|uniref:GNAT family N-acetyltransferase n=1 Tax=Kiloniella sp. TaxID=1938587 RepID=UPI003B01B0C9